MVKYKCIYKAVPTDIQNPTHQNPIGLSMNATPLMLSPSKVLSPHLSHCARFKNVIASVTAFLKLP
jgi:hypothetical protein